MTSLTDVTQAYLASSFADQAIKPPVRLAATVNVTPIGIGQTIDGAVTQLGDRILLTAQTDARQNGIRVVSDGVWPVPGDFSNLVSGTLFTATAGVANAGQYSLTTANPIILGVTSLTFMTSTVGGLAAETAARIAADTSLQTNITAEAATRASADTTLQTNITIEASARAAADTAITTNLAASTGSTLVGFTQSGTGSVTRPVQDKLREIKTSGDNPTIGSGNIFVITGDTAITSGARNIAIGGPDIVSPTGAALASNTTGNSNIAIGAGALKSNTTGSNQAIGEGALRNNTTGNENLAVGGGALSACTTGNTNVSIGGGSSGFVSTGNSNVALGVDALHGTQGSEITGDNNLAIGTLALQRAQTIAADNVAIGSSSLQSMLTGNHNVALGFFAGGYATGSNELYIDNQDRGNTAGDKAGALLYGNFNSTPANQTLVANARLSFGAAAQGSFTITGTGFTATIIGTAFYMIIGNTVFMDIPALSGTSNTTAFTLTGIPAVIQPISNQRWFFSAQDNTVSLTSPSLASFIAGGGTITLFKDASGAAWTGSGTKAYLGRQSISYSLN